MGRGLSRSGFHLILSLILKVKYAHLRQLNLGKRLTWEIICKIRDSFWKEENKDNTRESRWNIHQGERGKSTSQ